MTLRSRGVALGAAVGSLSLVAGCSGDPEIASYGLDDADQAACEAFVADLPAVLADEDEVEVDGDGDPVLGAAYGDPAITVTCGVPTPDGFDQTSSCEVADGVGWYVAPEAFDDQDADVVLTAAGYRPAVAVEVPGELRPDAPAAAIAELAALVEQHLTLEQRCS
ncbi:hypothetical protein GCM10023340_31190 [Nocardioides marinquilinus]|uniref:DUF3515 domain-containing protein n=1 Tax=Nocardioides marinquilinus TaxID=1210400 RepID=A0ABP9PXH4_9ACTN